MASSRRYVISAAMFIQLLMLTAVASPLADGVNPLGDYTKMNNDLIEELETSDDSKIVPVIFQLNSPMTESDENRLTELGFDLMGFTSNCASNCIIPYWWNTVLTPRFEVWPNAHIGRFISRSSRH